MIHGMPTVLAALLVLAQPPAGPDADAARKAAADRLATMKAEAARYHFRPGREGNAGATTLHPEPLLRWSNPVALEDDAGLFLWTRGGRPEAAAQFFVRKEDGGDNWMHEFQSLSEAPLAVEWEGRTVWSPSGPGLRFQPVPGAPTPDRSPAQRLRQMGEIARTFTASVEFRFAGESHYALRLLPKPVHRYGSDDGHPIDGSIWAFVQGTNPEVLLLIEARPGADAGGAWSYAPAPMTSYAAEVRKDGNPVWKVDRQPIIPTTDTEGPYLFRLKVPPAR